MQYDCSFIRRVFRRHPKLAAKTLANLTSLTYRQALRAVKTDELRALRLAIEALSAKGVSWPKERGGNRG